MDTYTAFELSSTVVTSMVPHFEKTEMFSQSCLVNKIVLLPNNSSVLMILLVSIFEYL